MRRLLLLAGWVVSASVFAAEEVVVLPAIQENRVVVSNLTVARVNPLGLANLLRLGYQRRLFGSDAMALRDNFVFIGTSPALNPSGTKVGPTIEIQPFSMLNLRATYDFVGYFGAFDGIHSFATPMAEFSDRVLDEDETYSTTGTRLTLEAKLQARLGPIILRNRLGFERWAISLRDGATVFYDPTDDTLHPNNGWTLSDDLDVMYQANASLIIGARLSLMHSFYGAEQSVDPALDPGRNDQSRLGVMGVYLLPFGSSARFSRPAIIANVAWFLNHRYRAGQEGSQLIPYVLAGFSFQSDLLDP